MRSQKQYKKTTPCSCTRYVTHCLAHSAPEQAKRPSKAVSNRKHKRQAEVARTAANTAAGRHDSSTMAAMMEQTANEDLSRNPSRVVLAVDDIDNDKTDTFGPFITPASPKPATSCLDEITFGGDANLQRDLRALCSEYSDIFSDTLPAMAADLEPSEIHVDKAKWEQDANRTPTRPQSSKKMAEI